MVRAMADIFEEVLTALVAEHGGDVRRACQVAEARAAEGNATHAIIAARFRARGVTPAPATFECERCGCEKAISMRHAWPEDGKAHPEWCEACHNWERDTRRP